MIIAYDTEFIEDGQTIDLISIGMAAGDGRELYRICDDPWSISRAVAHPWLREHIIPSLPVRLLPGGWEWDHEHPAWPSVAPREQVARDVRDFILAVPEPQMWADYGAYDHVALAQLFGDMTCLPAGVPMWTHDLQQEVQRLGNPALPSMPGVTEHDALSDAREVLWRLRWLDALAPAGGAR